MKAIITGDILPVLEIDLLQGEKIIAETGELSWKTPNVNLRTTTAMAGSTGLFGAIGRTLSGGSLFMTEYTAERQAGYVAFSSRIPGLILEEQVDGRHHYMIHKNGFMCATEGIKLSTGFQQKIGVGFLAGNGFLMQKLSGNGRFWVQLGGHVVVKDLLAGESLDIHPGHLGMLESTVNIEITTLPGLANKFFGGDGLFLARVTGPGRVWLQTLTLPNLAHALQPYFIKSNS